MINVSFFLKKVGAAGFPEKVKESSINVWLEEKIYLGPYYNDPLKMESSFHDLSSPIEKTNSDMAGLIYHRNGQKMITENFVAYIESRHLKSQLIRYTSKPSKLEGELTGGFRTVDASKYLTLDTVYIRFQGNQRYEAKGFIKYEPSELIAKPLSLEEYGRFFLKYPDGRIFTALLAPAAYSEPRSPKHNNSSTSSRSRQI